MSTIGTSATGSLSTAQPRGLPALPLALDAAKLNSIVGRESQAKLNTEEKDEAASQFEEMFVSLMLKEMRSSLDDEGGLFGGGTAGDTYGGLFDQYMGEHIADNGGIGFGKQILRYIEAQQP